MYWDKKDLSIDDDCLFELLIDRNVNLSIFLTVNPENCWYKQNNYI